MLSVLSKFVWHSYRQAFARSLLLLAALISASAGLTAVSVLNGTAKQQYKNAQQPLVQGVYWQIKAEQPQHISKQDYARLRRLGWSQLVAVQAQFVPFTPSHTAAGIEVLGVDTFAILSLPPTLRQQQFTQSQSYVASLTSSWQQQGALLLHSRNAARLGLEHGQRLPSELSLPPVAVVDIDGLGNQALTDISVVQRATQKTELSYLLVVGQLTDQQRKRLAADLPDHMRLHEIVTGEQADTLTNSFHLNLFAMSVLMLLVCLFVAGNALYLLLARREANLKVLRQLGIGRRHISLLQMMELILLALLCSAPGVWLGTTLAAWLSPAVLSTLNMMYDVHVGFISLSYWGLYSQSAVSCAAGAVLAAGLPLRRLSQRLASVQPAIAGHASRTALWTCLTMAAVAGLLWPLADQLIFSFALIAAVILCGCAFLIASLPAMLTRLAHALPSKLLIARWCLADARTLVRYANISFCAFFIAVTANVGMNLMVSSFRQATDDWLQQRLDASAYLRFEDQAQVNNIAELARPFDVVERVALQASYAGSPVDVRSLSLIHNADSLQFDRQQADAMALFARNQGLLVNQQLWIRHTLTLGEPLDLQLADGTRLSLPVVGVYRDYGNPASQVLLPLSTLQSLGGEVQSYGLIAPAALAIDDALDALQQRLQARGARFQLIDGEALQDLSMQTFDATFVVTDSLNLVTLLVAAISLAISLFIVDQDKAPQRALLRSLGISRVKLFSLLLSQQALVSLLVALSAIPLGMALSWLLINLVNVQAFAWRYPLSISWAEISQILWVSLLVVVLVACVPLYVRNTKPLREQLQWLR